MNQVNSSFYLKGEKFQLCESIENSERGVCVCVEKSQTPQAFFFPGNGI